MTKCIVLGEAKSEEPKKAIEFIHCIVTNKDQDYSSNDTIQLNPATNPSDYKVIELITRSNRRYKYDIMYAYCDNRSTGYLYLGHWNDGIV